MSQVGARRGSIARWLAERVGPRGSVLATDLDTRFLADLPTGVRVRRLDLRHDDVEAALDNERWPGRDTYRTVGRNRLQMCGQKQL